jgi:hypothetical protein
MDLREARAICSRSRLIPAISFRVGIRSSGDFAFFSGMEVLR